ncbi:MAG: gliding motility-associated C-terminal domain-containing protein, partial [Leadbetterella sp.]|nr:gliding motility-associated C-terminal domain-containing protein [Leadbetterella sp.]
RLVAVGCNSTVEWSNGSTGNVIFVGVGTYTAKCKNSCGTSLASNIINIEIGVLPKAPVIISNKLTVCGTDKVILTASVCEGGTIIWSMGGTGTSKEVATGTYTATCTNACGTSGNSNVIIIQNASAPVVPLLTSNKLTVCGTDKATLIASGCESGTISWSAGGTGTTIQVYAGTYSATCTNACGTSGNSNVISIVEKVAEAPIITASKTQICSPEEITLKATGCLTGVLQWSNGKTGRQIIVKPQFSTIYSAICIEEGSCQSSVSNNLNVRLIEIDKPIVACIKNIICEGEKVTITVENCTGEVKWSNGLVGHSIKIVPSSNTEYTAVCIEGECVSEVSEPICITVGSPNQPFVTCAKNTICLGETTTLTAQGCLGNVIWSNGFLGSTLKVSSQEVGTFNYSAICKSISGNCQSLPSKTIKVIVGGIVSTPTVISEISNICPFESLDLNNSILGNPSSAGGSFEFHISNSTNSAIVTSPGLVTGGEYYLFERSKEGCYSIPAKVTAKIVKCGVNGIKPDSTHKVDIEVSKTANLTNALIGGFVYYKIQVKNNKNVKATNLVIRDIVPSGLQIDSISTNAKIENGVIFAKIDSLSKNDVTTITYKAKVTSTGKIVNKAEVLSVDQMDPILSNNVSYFTINDDLFEREKVIGLSKHVGQILKLDSNKYEIPFTFNLSNMGTTNLNRIQLEDDLLATFGIDAILLDSTIQVVADSGLVVNPLFTGRIPNTSLLIDSLSNIPAGVSKSVRIKVKVKATNDQKDFFNSAKVFAGLNKTITDISTDGKDADPDNNGNPNDNSIPTSFRLNNDTLTSAIATSLTIVDSSLVDDFTYRVKYMVLVKNIGNTILENVYLTDSLSKMYPANIDFKVSEKGIVSSQSNLTPNVVFDGIIDHRLTLMDSTKKLKVGEIDTVYFTVDIKYGSNYGPYFNSVKAFGSDDFGNTVTDISNSGTKIIAIKSDSTVFYIPIDTTELSKLVLVPGGFSPNGDKINDEFKIEIKGSVEVENIIIVNRWGAKVFEEDNLERKMELIGWNGKSNQGIRLGTSDDVPAGTYFYILKIKGFEKPLVDFITIIR